MDDLVGRCTNDPLQTDLVRCVDFVLGGFYLFGTQPFFHAVELWDPSSEHAAALDDFFRPMNRKLDLLLGRPTGYPV